MKRVMWSLFGLILSEQCMAGDSIELEKARPGP